MSPEKFHPRALGERVLPLLLLACVHPPPVVEPLPTAGHERAAAEAAARVPDPARGGPPIPAGASPLPPFLGVDRAVARYVGAEACEACHPAAAATWRASAHARAYATLQERKAAYNPACFPCHVTGFGHPGGYAPTPALADVQCEACHGPASAHVSAPAAGYGALPSGAAACVACHTHERSPEFRFSERWGSVGH